MRDGQALWSREAIHRHLASKDNARHKEKEKGRKKKLITRNSSRKRDHVSIRSKSSISTSILTDKEGHTELNSLSNRHHTETGSREHSI